MKDFSLPAKIYIFSTILVGCGILAWILHNHTWQNLWAMFFLSGMASLALFFKVEGTTNRSHYNISFLIYGCTFAILGPEACIVVIILSNLVHPGFQHRFLHYCDICLGTSLQSDQPWDDLINI